MLKCIKQHNNVVTVFYDVISYYWLLGLLHGVGLMLDSIELELSLLFQTFPCLREAVLIRCGRTATVKWTVRLYIDLTACWCSLSSRCIRALFVDESS